MVLTDDFVGVLQEGYYWGLMYREVPNVGSVILGFRKNSDVSKREAYQEGTIRKIKDFVARKLDDLSSIVLETGSSLDSLPDQERFVEDYIVALSRYMERDEKGLKELYNNISCELLVSEGAVLGFVGIELYNRLKN